MVLLKMDYPNFECPICLDLIKDPISLPCGHNFCISCMQGFSYVHMPKCPVCRRSVPRLNYRVNGLLESFALSFNSQSPLKKHKEASTNLNGPKFTEFGTFSGIVLIIVAILLLYKYKARNLRRAPFEVYHILTKLLALVFAPALGNISSVWRFIITHFVSISFVSNI
jgi:Zinc finger, C3HC4 type (RING finger)